MSTEGIDSLVTLAVGLWKGVRVGVACPCP